MASDKKRRKAAKAKQAKPPTAGPFRHPDGDRRHRAAMAKAVKEAKQAKEMQQLIGAVEPPADADEE
jgi:hypothetical protein